MKPIHRGIVAAAALAVAALLPAAPLGAAEIRIGVQTLTSSADPHAQDMGPNNAARLHVYESLVRRTADTRFEPALAVSWRALDDTTWEFKLRPGVKFHDGSDFDAEDVVATFQRIPRIGDYAGSYHQYVDFITEIRAADPLTVVMKTSAPFPVMIPFMAAVGILPKRVADEAKREDFEAGTVNIGTGPYRHVEYVNGDRLVLQRNDAYWGAKEPWDKVTFRYLPNNATRTAALLAGDIDLVDRVNLTDLDRLKRDPRIHLEEGPTYFLLYLALDQEREPPPNLTGTGNRNPFKDRRVREAAARAINRQAIVDQVMEGHARVTTQLVPPGFHGFNPEIRGVDYDPARARALLQEAGYGDGFDLLLSASNNRYVNDAKVAQTVAQMLTRVGIRTKVETMPSSVLFNRRNRGEFGFFMAGWGSNTGEALFVLRSLIGGRNRDRNLGMQNFTGYANKEADDLIEEAARTIDDDRRGALLGRAMKLVMEDYGIMVLHEENTIWGMRKGITYRPRADGDTYAMGARPAP